MPVLKPYKRASAAFQGERTRIRIEPARPGDPPVVIGGPSVVVMAGPCAVESREMLLELAAFVKEAGAVLLRGGAFKPRTSPSRNDSG